MSTHTALTVYFSKALNADCIVPEIYLLSTKTELKKGLNIAGFFPCDNGLQYNQMLHTITGNFIPPKILQQ